MRNLVAAVPYLERNLAYKDDRGSRIRLATVYAYLGDDANYKRLCTQMQEPGNFYRRRLAEQASKAILLKPDLHDDLTQTHRLARWTSDQRAYHGWDYLCRALSECRQGDMVQTSQWAEWEALEM